MEKRKLKEEDGRGNRNSGISGENETQQKKG